MYSIQQEELFSFEELMTMQNDSKYSAILDHLPIGSILCAVNKKGVRGRPESLNTRAMIYSLIIGTMEHIRYTKDLVNRLKSSAEFRKVCRFTGSDRVPSEAAYSRLIARLQQSGTLRYVQDALVDKAIDEGLIKGEVLALDSTHLEAFDRNPKLDEKSSSVNEVTKEELELLPAEAQATKLEKPKRTKRGRVPKAEMAKWRQEVEAYEATLSVFERDVASMLPLRYEQLIRDMPNHPSIGAKGDPRGIRRAKFWYGYKLNLVVDTSSQYIVAGETCSAHVSDQRPAIILLKRVKERFSKLITKYVLADKGYDGDPVYRQIRELGAFPLIPLIHRSKPPEEVDKHFRPLCAEGHSYRYDSYEANKGSIKFTRPKECEACHRQTHGCQSVYKFQIDSNPRKYTAPGRGSKKFAEIFKQRTAIERVFAYLKLYFELGSTRRRGKRAFVFYDLSCLTYNLCKYALDQLNKQSAKQTA